MVSNPRLSITFTRRQIDFLEKEAIRLGVSLSEVVRQIVDGALIRAPMSKGWERAKARSLRPGPRHKLTEHQRREAIKRRDEGVETLAEIGRSYNVSGWTISRLTM
jgi:hypothetical protein